MILSQRFIKRKQKRKQTGTRRGKLELADGDCLVFLGDSITHQCLYTQYVEDYFYTRFPNIRVKYHNAGVGGAKAWDALERFERDVAAYKPKYVTILLGMNETVVAAIEASGKTRSRVTLVAPISGVVTELAAREGMTVMPGATLFRINGLSTVWAHAEVPESQAASLRPGAKVQASSPAVPVKPQR